MRVFIIGATGYVGSHVAKALAAAGHVLTAFSRSEQSDRKLVEQRITPCRGDLDDRDAIKQRALAADVTIFAARVMGKTEPWQYEQQVVGDLLVALEGTGKGFILTSGSGVLGQQTLGDWSEDTYAEDDPFTPPPMMLDRVATETLVRASAARGIRGMVIRPPLIWGYELPSMVVHMLRSALATGAVCYIGRGLNCYTNVHIDDLADLYGLAAQHGVAGALYHATQGEIPHRWIAEKVAQAMDLPTRSVTMEEGIKLWGPYNASAVMAASSRSRGSRARRELGWAPSRYDLLEEVQRLVKLTVADPRETARVLGRRPIG